MKTIIDRAIIIAAALLITAAAVLAQDKPAATPAAPAIDADAGQPIPDDARRVLQALQLRDAGLADAAALLQKERDAIAAEWSRAIAKLQAAAPAGTELSPALTYVKKAPDKTGDQKGGAPPK